MPTKAFAYDVTLIVFHAVLTYTFLQYLNIEFKWWFCCSNIEITEK